jgi:arabinose-5-phosphate isomerase
MTTNFKSIKCNDLAIDAAEIMEKNKIFSLVVNSEKNKEDSMGLITMHQLLEAGII